MQVRLRAFIDDQIGETIRLDKAQAFKLSAVQKQYFDKQVEKVETQQTDILAALIESKTDVAVQRLIFKTPPSGKRELVVKRESFCSGNRCNDLEDECKHITAAGLPDAVVRLLEEVRISNNYYLALKKAREETNTFADERTFQVCRFALVFPFLVGWGSGRVADHFCSLSVSF